ncbi:AfsR/SARP family transcriptional regulator, partial [Phytoactinopolyspora endophytica]|uniref:AfsR/SARP family transcriptional regulator n=1 Tax=Phytoactinopolyspora endophytica TaxID=1642495 RepID=UPI00197BF4B3
MERVRPALRLEVLGPLRLVVDGVVVDVRGSKRRSLLAILALAEGRMVTAEHLLDTLWPAALPESGRQALHTQVSRLRTNLGTAASRLQGHQYGYRLELLDGELDLAEAKTLLVTARRAAASGAAEAFEILRRAHSLWRGPVLADLTDRIPISAAVEGCTQLYQEVTDALIAGAVDAGQADGIVGLATKSLTSDPLREPAVLLLMRVLAASGRAPAALQAGRDYRRRLTDETGLDPSPALDELERTIASGAAAAAPRSPLPVRPGTRLVGREAHVASLHRLLAAERLVTVVGPGGVGKTRVAVEAARSNDAAVVLLLAPVTDPATIPHVLASALNLNVAQGDVLTACLAFLGDKPGLLVIDNCEHLLDTVRDTIGAVLENCPHQTILATSREPLGIPAEYAFRLNPLPVPGSDPGVATEEELSRVPSVAVFLDRAGRVRPDRPPTAEDLRLISGIVRRLDGMPLAIELAAGRLSTFSLADLHARLDRSLDLLGGGRSGADARHRTLRDTVEWSYRLLSEDERRLFRHLSVFVDGVDLATAERLATDLHMDADPGSVLSRLVDASMLEAHFDDGTRYRL